MPIYEYRCKECQQLFEEWCQHIEDDSVPHNCPICKGQAKRLVSNTSFALKGNGWYATDYGTHKGACEDKAAPSCQSADAPAPKPECAPAAAQ